jgi:hypothetical protein
VSRYNGFTCPNCGSHRFGTHAHHRSMGDKYRHGTLVGTCHENQYSGNGCIFEWDRGNPIEEAECIYQQTLEEYVADFEKGLAAIKGKK